MVGQGMLEAQQLNGIGHCLKRQAARRTGQEDDFTAWAVGGRATTPAPGA